MLHHLLNIAESNLHFENAFQIKLSKNWNASVEFC
jgi:hypothetical protein